MIVDTDYAVLATPVTFTIAVRAEERVVVKPNYLSVATTN
jgi:hypothetical protein